MNGYHGKLFLENAMKGGGQYSLLNLVSGNEPGNYEGLGKVNYNHKKPEGFDMSGLDPVLQHWLSGANAKSLFYEQARWFIGSNLSVNAYNKIVEQSAETKNRGIYVAPVPNKRDQYEITVCQPNYGLSEVERYRTEELRYSEAVIDTNPARHISGKSNEQVVLSVGEEFFKAHLARKRSTIVVKAVGSLSGNFGAEDVYALNKDLLGQMDQCNEYWVSSYRITGGSLPFKVEFGHACLTQGEHYENTNPRQIKDRYTIPKLVSDQAGLFADEKADVLESIRSLVSEAIFAPIKDKLLLPDEINAKHKRYIRILSFCIVALVATGLDVAAGLLGLSVSLAGSPKVMLWMIGVVAIPVAIVAYVLYERNRYWRDKVKVFTPTSFMINAVPPASPEEVWGNVDVPEYLARNDGAGSAPSSRHDSPPVGVGSSSGDDPEDSDEDLLRRYGLPSASADVDLDNIGGSESDGDAPAFMGLGPAVGQTAV